MTDFFKRIFGRWTKPQRVLGEDVVSLPGLKDESITVWVAKSEGALVCWTCFAPLDAESIDVPLNAQGVWTRLHRRCYGLKR